MDGHAGTSVGASCTVPSTASKASAPAADSDAAALLVSASVAASTAAAACSADAGLRQRFQQGGVAVCARVRSGKDCDARGAM